MTSAPRLSLLAAAVLGALALVPGAGAAPRDENPCLTAAATSLRCPDLVMRAPFDLGFDRRVRPGRTLLRGGNSIDSEGRGPAELRGRRDGKRTMAARQRIVRTDGSRRSLDTGARLYFKAIPGQGRYWKFSNAARFELWRLDPLGNRVERVRVGPKVIYCLRDLKRSHPSRRSPRRMVYPKCNQSSRTRAVTLGTSVGWSDVYPAAYHEQWIDVTGLRGRFSFVHIADPRNGVFESDEQNNDAETIVNLPSGRVEAHRDGDEAFFELGPADADEEYDY